MLRLSAKSVPPAVEIAEDPRADPRPGRAPLANARAPGLWLTRRAADPDGHVLPGPDLRWPHPRPPSDPRHHSGGPPPRARCRDLAPARPGSGVAARAVAGRRRVAPGGALQPGTVLPPGAGADQRRAAHRLRAHAPLGSADGRDLRPAARTRAPGRRGRLLPRRHRPLVSVFRVQRGSHPVARAGRDAGLVDVVHRGRLLHADRDPLRGRDGLSLLAVPTLRRVGDGSALSRDLSAPRTGMMSENPNDRDPRRVSPHPVLTAYYRDEAGHRRFLTRLFDDTASQYDRISDLMSLGSGAWYRRYALRRRGTLLIVDFTRPRSRVGLGVGRFYLKVVVSWMARLGTGGKEARLLVRYCWDTLEHLVTSETILAAMTSSGFVNVRRVGWFGILSEYVGRKP